MGKALPRSLKIAIWKRDKYRCQYCGRVVKDYNISEGILPDNAATVDHILPRSKGGMDSPENLVTCCYGCNKKLQDKFWTYQQKKDYITGLQPKKFLMKLEGRGLKKINGKKGRHRKRWHENWL